MTVQFDYQLAVDQPSNLSGAYRLIVELGDESGWRRTIELQPTTPFSGGTFSASADIDLARVQALIDSFESHTAL